MGMKSMLNGGRNIIVRSDIDSWFTKLIFLIGNFVYASALGNNVLILNKIEDADELFERRAGIYSDRPVIPMLKLWVKQLHTLISDVIMLFSLGWDYNFSFLPYGKSWRFHRQICQQNFRAEAARGYYPLLLKKVHEMLSRLLTDPDKFEEHHKMWVLYPHFSGIFHRFRYRLSISVPMITMYGYEVKSFEDPCIVAAEESIAAGVPFMLPGGTWLNTIPALTKINLPLWFPGATTWKIAAKVRELSKEMERIPFEFAKKSFVRHMIYVFSWDENKLSTTNQAEGAAVDSFVSKYLRKKEEVGALEEEEQAVRNIAATVYGGKWGFNSPCHFRQGSLTVNW